MKNTFFSIRLVRYLLLSVMLFGVTGLVMAESYPSYVPVKKKESRVQSFSSAGAGIYVPNYEMRSTNSKMNTMTGPNNQSVPSMSRRYQSGIYEPFCSAVPSDDANPAGPSQNSHVRKGKILGPDTDPAQESPVGEPWILLAFAAIFAGGLTYRKLVRR